ncbi:MAG TPA: 3-keto-5-aminohexanoate cleavage protein [Opitutus sp.]|nr:3-keto-5-aminohexanoate cleavage protein [Opitutus sp.]
MIKTQSDALIVNLAPTGMVPTREHSPHVPLTVAEIVEDVCACVAAGASMAHLHARDAHGAPSCDASIFGEIIAGIRERHPDTVIVVSTSGRLVSDVAQRASALNLGGPVKPDMASLTLGSLNFVNQASVNSPATIQRLAELMKERGIKPELEIFDLGMVNFACRLIDRGLIEPPFYFNLLLGNIATAQLDLLHLAALVNGLPPGSTWSVAGIGRTQAVANAMGAIVGHGVRTGLEDNLWLDDQRTRLATNRELVARCTAVAAALGRPLATAAQVRTRLGLQPRP